MTDSSDDYKWRDRRTIPPRPPGLEQWRQQASAKKSFERLDPVTGDEVRTPKQRWKPMKYKPIRLMCRQVEKIHDMDFRLAYEPFIKRRLASWSHAWRILLEHVFQYPHFEWWLLEDLIPEPELGRQERGGWSQFCPECERWGIVWLAPWHTQCIHCGAAGVWQYEPITTQPRCSWKTYDEAVRRGDDLSKRPRPAHAPWGRGPKPDMKARMADAIAAVGPREAAGCWIGTKDGTVIEEARAAGGDDVD